MSQIIIRVKQFITVRFINPIKSFYWVHFINPTTKWSFRFLRNPYYFFPIFFAVLILLGSGSLSDFLKCYMKYSIDKIYLNIKMSRVGTGKSGVD